MIIAIDIDNTWTKDPRFFKSIYTIALAFGHNIIIATGRKEYSNDMDKFDLPDVPILYCGDELKETVALRNGYTVDVWIDDSPGTIQECKKLSGEL